MIIRSLFRLFAVCAVALSLCGGERDTLVFLPLENLSGVDNASHVAAELMRRRIEQRGWHVAPSERIEAILEKDRIRYFDSIEPAFRLELLKESQSSAFASGTIYTWREGDAPMIGLSARLTGADGKLLWSEIIGISSADTEGLLGFGRSTTIDQLAREAIDRLLHRFPPPGTSRTLNAGPSSLLHRGPPTFRSAALGHDKRARIAILPFDTASHERIAPRIVADTLAIRLAASDDFEVIEPAELRAAARAAGIRTFAFIPSTELAKVGEKLGTALFLRGSIYTWKDAPVRSTNVPPEAQLEMSLVDVKSGRILWNTIHSRRGDDYEGLLLLGRVTDGVTLTDRIVTEMIKAGEHARQRGAALARTKGSSSNASTLADSSPAARPAEPH